MVPYPNPCVGTCDEVTVQVALSEPGPVVLQLFTTAYRKISETTLTTLSVGVTPVKVALRDKKGEKLANGVYYLRVVSGGNASIGKVVVLR